MLKKLAVLTALALIVSACSFDVEVAASSSATPTDSSSPNANLDAELIELSVTQTNESGTSEPGIERLSYPKFGVSSGGVIAEQISSAINQDISSQVAKFLKQGRDFDVDPAFGGSTLDITVRDVRQTASFVTFDILNCEYLSGAAHGYCFGFTHAYSALTGNQLSIVEAVAPALLPAFYEYVEERLFIQTDPYYLFEPEYIDLGENSFFNSWSLTSGVIGIKFAPYEVGPYASGEIELYLNFEQLRPYLRADSELAKLLTAGE